MGRMRLSVSRAASHARAESAAAADHAAAADSADHADHFADHADHFADFADFADSDADRADHDADSADHTAADSADSADHTAADSTDHADPAADFADSASVIGGKLRRLSATPVSPAASSAIGANVRTAASASMNVRVCALPSPSVFIIRGRYGLSLCRVLSDMASFRIRT
jgi:hypothetical protein